VGQTLIKNAVVVSMETSIGEIEGDILVDGNRIAAIGRNLAAPEADVIDGGGRIVIPGLVNSHIHTWEYQLRGIGSDWVGQRDYHGNMHKNLATRWRNRASVRCSPAAPPSRPSGRARCRTTRSSSPAPKCTACAPGASLPMSAWSPWRWRSSAPTGANTTSRRTTSAWHANMA